MTIETPTVESHFDWPRVDLEWLHVTLDDLNWPKILAAPSHLIREASLRLPLKAQDENLFKRSTSMRAYSSHSTNQNSANQNSIPQVKSWTDQLEAIKAIVKIILWWAIQWRHYLRKWRHKRRLHLSFRESSFIHMTKVFSSLPPLKYFLILLHKK